MVSYEKDAIYCEALWIDNFHFADTAGIAVIAGMIDPQKPRYDWKAASRFNVIRKFCNYICLSWKIIRW